SFLEKVEHFSFPVEIMNVYEEVAKRFWQSPPYVLEEQADTHLLIVGYDALGRQIASETEKAYQKSTNKQGFLITVLDSFSEYKFLDSMEEIPFDIEKDSVREIIEEKQKIFTHIFICLDEDYIDLMEGIELSEIFSNTPIYMNFTEESIEQTFMIATTKTKKSLYSTGIIQDVLTKDYLNI